MLQREILFTQISLCLYSGFLISSSRRSKFISIVCTVSTIFSHTLNAFKHHELSFEDFQKFYNNYVKFEKQGMYDKKSQISEKPD